MDLHHSPSPSLPHVDALHLLSLQNSLCASLDSRSLSPRTVPTRVSCPSLCFNLWTPERRRRGNLQLIPGKHVLFYIYGTPTLALYMKILFMEAVRGSSFHLPAGALSEQRSHGPYRRVPAPTSLHEDASKTPAHGMKRLSPTLLGTKGTTQRFVFRNTLLLWS